MADSRDIIIWGIHPVLEILHSAPRQVKALSIQSGSRHKLREVIELAEKSGLTIDIVPKINIPGEAGANHQGVLAVIKENYLVDFEELVGKEPDLVVALDSISDPHNLGAIIRSAAAAGAAGVLIPKDRAAQITGTVVKVAAGALAHLKICRVTNLAESLALLKDRGFWIFGAVGESSETIYEADFSGPTCLVIGSEGKGIRPLVRKQCDFLVKIPMKKTINSLNASVAAGIILFEIVRKKEVGKK
ncbi:MAG: 23S rRNA (guanosine(2251)-2'-O)-methyltransferase RlmB [Desulfobulbaceae bacterium]|nr:23S rRNA (guanosine(2251)-2'-O)-methyltransferase RlmB [Desulfobulbaceae bacterium]